MNILVSVQILGIGILFEIREILMEQQILRLVIFRILEP